MSSSSKASEPKNQRRKPKLARSSGRRSHGGCLTCKQRHVKCDETRPACSKCAKKDLVCEGYPQSLKWSYKHQPTGTDMTRETLKVIRTELAPELALQNENGEDQQPDISAGIETDDFASSSLTGFDSLHSVDQIFEGNVDFVAADIPTFIPWQMDLSIDPTLGTVPVLESFVHSRQQGLFLDLEVAPSPPRELAEERADSATRLIGNWFNEVCPAWSGFDSNMNMNRKLAQDLWHSSSVVFSALQSASASFVCARLPHVRSTALSLLRTATWRVQSEMEKLKRKPYLESTPTGVIFSLICLGTTICWLDARRIGWPFLQDAKNLVQLTLQSPFPISDSEAEILDFFRKSLVYWDMLISFVYDPEPEVDIRVEAMSPGLVQPSLLASGEPSFDPIPHPWTGISSLTSRLFTQVMRICRTYRRRITRGSGSNTISLLPAIPEIEEEARKLEEYLLQLQFSPTPVTNDPGDPNTPYIHLYYLADAYQMAALLQLYITFPVLFSQPNSTYIGDVGWHKWIIPFALKLTEVLERVPTDSGSRIIQPILYICAATGLRYSSGSQPIGSPANSEGYGRNLRPMESILDYLHLLEDPVEPKGGDTFSVSQLALDVSKARNFVLRRLSKLKENLHPGPTSIAEELVKAIWTAYDEEPRGCTSVYWIDIMEKKDFLTLFG